MAINNPRLASGLALGGLLALGLTWSYATPAAEKKDDPAAKAKAADKAAPKAATKPAPAAKPAAPKTAAPATKAPTPTAKPAAPADPLAGLPKAVELPPLDAGQPKTLGKLAVSPTAIVIVSFLGGERVLSSGRMVELKEGDDGRSWTFQAAIKAGGEPVALAELRLVQQDLQFSWSEAAAEFSGAGGLKNGALQIAAGPSKRVVALRATQAGEALAFTLEEPASVSAELPDPPRADGVKLEFDLPTIEHGGKRVNWRIVGGATLKANDSVVAQSVRLPNLLMKVDVSLARGFKLTATPLFWTVDPKKPQPLTGKRVAAALGEVKAYQAKLEAAQKQLGKSKSNPQATAVSKQLSAVKKAVGELTQLAEFVNSKPQAVISYRLFHEVDGQIVDLVVGKKK